MAPLRLPLLLSAAASASALSLQTTRTTTVSGPPGPRRGPGVTGGGAKADDAAIPKEADIKKQWSGIGEVSETLFWIACQAKHGGDVMAEAKDMAKRSGPLSQGSIMAEVGKVQARNLEDFNENCQHSQAGLWKKCRAGCTQKFAAGGADSNAELKMECTRHCDAKNKRDEKMCTEHTANLQSVYGIEKNLAVAQASCRSTHCPHYPDLTDMLFDEKEGGLAKTKAEAKKRCTDTCTKKREAFEQGCEARCKDGDDSCTQACKAKNTKQDRCESACNGKCKVGQLQQCAKKVRDAASKNVTKQWCLDVWRDIYSSEDVDWKSGNVAAFLNQFSSVKKGVVVEA